MEILESWQNDRGENFAIAIEPTTPYVAMCEIDGELFDFSGSPGLDGASFETLDEARAFLLRGFEQQKVDPDAFLNVLGNRPGWKRRSFDDR